MSPSQSSDSNLPASVVSSRLSQKVRARIDGAHGKQTAPLEQQILSIVTSKANELVVRTNLIKLGAVTTKAVGACFVDRNSSELWAPMNSSVKMGRLPDANKFADEVSDKCEEFAASNGLQVATLECMDGLSAVFAPIRLRNNKTQLMMLIYESGSKAAVAVPQLQQVSLGMQLWLKGESANDSDWQVQSLSAILELVAKIERQKSTKAGSEEAVNQLGNLLGCSAVAIGLTKNHRMRVKAISGIAKIDIGSEANRNWRQALIESMSRKESAVFPAIDPENNFLLQAHKQLASFTHAESVFSCPLVTDDDVARGSIVFTGPAAMLTDSRFERFALAAAPAIANSLHVVKRTNRGPITQCINWLCEKISLLKRLVMLAMVVGFCLLMLVPITYRVRCSCVTEPVSRRYAVAPFDGQIVTGHAEAGDKVDKDEVLAEMDGRTIRWELSGVAAEREQSLRTREMELSERNIPQTILAELEYDRLISEEEILEHKRENLQIKSPIEGIVLSGSLERAEAASIQTGQVLFEIGPIKPMRVEVAIPSNEIAQVTEGLNAKIWIDGQEDTPLEGEIIKLHPRSETRDAKNVFIAVLEFPNEDEKLRPGMKGSVRIDGEKRSLGWSLFHKPINWVRSRVVWW